MRTIVHGPTVVQAYNRNQRARKESRTRPVVAIDWDELTELMSEDNDELTLMLNQARIDDGQVQDRMERETAVALRMMREVG